jgi:hypothetical protein
LFKIQSHKIVFSKCKKNESDYRFDFIVTVFVFSQNANDTILKVRIRRISNIYSGFINLDLGIYLFQNTSFLLQFRVQNKITDNLVSSEVL